jgi:hypothetical protein
VQTPDVQPQHMGDNKDARPQKQQRTQHHIGKSGARARVGSFQPSQFFAAP